MVKGKKELLLKIKLSRVNSDATVMPLNTKYSIPTKTKTKFIKLEGEPSSAFQLTFLQFRRTFPCDAVKTPRLESFIIERQNFRRNKLTSKANAWTQAAVSSAAVIC